jgi:hypothetical protein
MVSIDEDYCWMRPFGDHDDTPHTLLPLTLAVGLVRSKVQAGHNTTGRGPEGDADAIAAFIAGVVPLYEFAHDPSVRPRMLERGELDTGLFRGGGQELHFIDGRPTKRYLAVNAVDVECVIALLRNPQRAAEIRSRFVRLRSERLKARSVRLRAQAAKLRAEAVGLRPSRRRSA